MKRQFVVVLVIIWLVLDVSFRILGKYAPEFDIVALQVSNFIMLGLSLLAYRLVNTRISNNPHAFVRGVYSATLLKLMVCMFSMLAYVFMNKGHLHKQTVFAMMGVYMVYTAAETIVLSKLAKTKKENNSNNS
jgi:hypothetical protein